MESIAQAITRFLSKNNNPLGLFILGVSALIEYIFPPFPGDTVTLFSAVLITRYKWSFILVFFSILLGSGVGAWLDILFGAFILRRYGDTYLAKRPRLKASLDRALDLFRKKGAWIIIFNRFLPALRAVFFIAAGMAGMKVWLVVFFGLLSAAAWNGMILGVGYAFGSNWDKLKTFFSTYTLVLWILIGLVLIGLVVFFFLKSRRKK